MRALVKYVKGTSIWSDALRRLLSDKVAVFCFVVIVFYLLVGISVRLGWLAADWEVRIGDPRAAPDLSKDWRFWMGLDWYGRSVLLKTIQGTYTALYVGLMTSLISIPLGVLLGCLAGYFGGFVDDVITWFYTTLANIPEILLIVAIGLALGKGLGSAILALGLTTWVSLARLMRAEVLKHRNREYVTAASSLGAGHPRRIFLHILPNVLHIIIISFSLRFVTAIKSEVVLTYLGMGAPAGTASWGVMIDEAKGELINGQWWNLTSATVAMFVVVLAFSLLADSLRDAFDPKLRT